MKESFLFLAFLIAWPDLMRGQESTNDLREKKPELRLVFAIQQKPKTEKEFETKEVAIKEAGETHNADPQVIEALLDNIDYSVRHPGPEYFSPMNAPKYAIHPARDALKTIGKPAIPFILERIKQGEDELPEGYVAPNSVRPVYLNSSTNSTLQATVQLLKPEEYAVLLKAGQYTSLLKAVAGKQSSALLKKAISDLSEQKSYLEKSLETVESIKP